MTSIYKCLLALSFIPFISCGEKLTFKPKGYFRFDLPEKTYNTFDSVGYPYKFDYPDYATLNFLEDKENPYWINIDIPEYTTTIHLSYKAIDKNTNLTSLTEDAHKFLYKHSLKADAITEEYFNNADKNISGFLFNISGNAASAVQFIATDSVSNFIRGSLYFYSAPNRDSLDPLINFFREDIEHLMESLEFKK